MNTRFIALAASALVGFILGAGSSVLQRDSQPSDAPNITTPGEPDAQRQYSTFHVEPEELVGAALGALSGELDYRGLARLGEVLRDLQPEQIGELLDRLERGSSRETAHRRSWLVSWWVDRDAASATEWLKPKLANAAQDGPLDFSFESEANGKLIIAWAKAAPERAVEYAKLHAGTGLARQLLLAVAQPSSGTDERERLTLLLTFPAGKARSGATELLVWTWAKREPDAAFAAASALPHGSERDKSMSAALRAWGNVDAPASLDHFSAAEMKDDHLLRELLRNVATDDPARAVAFLGRSDSAQLARCGPLVVESWAKHDPVAALSWALANGIEITLQGESEQSVAHDAFRRITSASGYSWHPLATALKAQPEATIAWLRSLPPGTDRERLTELAVTWELIADDAVALFASLSPEAAARTAYQVAQKFQGKLEEGRAWAETLPPGRARSQAWRALGASVNKPLDLPPGADRDAMLSGLATGESRRSDPVDALQHVMQIGDVPLRHDVFDQVMERSIGTEAYARPILGWLETADVPQEWKSRWREAAAKEEWW